MAGTTRLELATSAVTGQRSNQLNYVPSIFIGLVGTRFFIAFSRPFRPHQHQNRHQAKLMTQSICPCSLGIVTDEIKNRPAPVLP
jgi:hypothetical protein